MKTTETRPTSGQAGKRARRRPTRLLGRAIFCLTVLRRLVTYITESSVPVTLVVETALLLVLLIGTSILRDQLFFTPLFVPHTPGYIFILLLGACTTTLQFWRENLFIKQKPTPNITYSGTSPRKQRERVRRFHQACREEIQTVDQTGRL